jgi:hypothetical protein
VEGPAFDPSKVGAPRQSIQHFDHRKAVDRRLPVWRQFNGAKTAPALVHDYVCQLACNKLADRRGSIDAVNGAEIAHGPLRGLQIANDKGLELRSIGEIAAVIRQSPSARVRIWSRLTASINTTPRVTSCQKLDTSIKVRPLFSVPRIRTASSVPQTLPRPP